MKRIRFSSLALALLSFTFSLGAAELFLRAAEIPRESVPLDPKAALEDHETYFKFQPHLKDIPFASALLSTNEFGYRDSEMRLAKSDGIFRIALIGDSWGAGWGLSEEDSIPKLLERRLRDRSLNFHLEVLNFSIPGQNLKGYYYTLVHEVMKFNPDYIVILAHLNDIELNPFEGARSRSEQRNSSPLLSRGMILLKQLHFYKLLYIKIIVPIADLFDIPDFGSLADFAAKYKENTPQFLVFADSMKKLGSFLREEKKEASAFVVPIPFLNNDRYPLQDINERVLSLYREQGFRVHDLSPLYRNRPRQELTIHELDAHPNAHASSLIADKMTEELLKDLGTRGKVPLL